MPGFYRQSLWILQYFLARNQDFYHRLLEEGTFQFPFAETGRKEIAAWELAVLLEGIDVKAARRRKRYRLPAEAERKEAGKVSETAVGAAMREA